MNRHGNRLKGVVTAGRQVQRVLLHCALAVAVLAGTLRAAVAQDEDPDVAPARVPAVGRPPDFGGAVGQTFAVLAKIEPGVVQAEDPLILTLVVTAPGAVQEPPRRPDLLALAEFRDDFLIRDLPDAPTATGPPWTFRYELRPRTAQVKKVPAFHFSYYNPLLGKLQPEKGWQAQFTSPLDLKVRPRDAVGLGTIEGRQDVFNADDPVYQFIPGDSVLRHDDYASLPGPLVLIVLFLLPPVACVGWYALWRHRYPGAAEEVRRRRSRAAKLALKALREAGEASFPAQGERAAGVLAVYLRQRLDLAAAEPTPAEITASLQRAGCSQPVAAQAGELLRLCDAARFAPLPVSKPGGVIPTAQQLILALEAEPWSS